MKEIKDMIAELKSHLTKLEANVDSSKWTDALEGLENIDSCLIDIRDLLIDAEDAEEESEEQE